MFYVKACYNSIFLFFIHYGAHKEETLAILPKFGKKEYACSFRQKQPPVTTLVIGRAVRKGFQKRPPQQDLYPPNTELPLH